MAGCAPGLPVPRLRSGRALSSVEGPGGGRGGVERSSLPLNKIPRPWAGDFMVTLLLFLAAIVSPTLAIGGPRRTNILWTDASPFHLLWWSGTTPKPIDRTLSAPQTERLARTVSSLSRPGEILWSNAPYAVGLIAALAHRPMASAMLAEVSPAASGDPMAAAHLLVWFKIDPFPETPALSELVRRYHLQLVADDALAWVFRNPAATHLAHPPHAIIPLWLAFVLLCGALGLIVWDFHRNFAQQNF